MIRSAKIFALLCVLSAAVTAVTGTNNASDRLTQHATNPFNATYLLEGETVGLMDGRSELPAAPGSAIKTKTAVMGLPVYGDMDGDGDEDAVLLITHDPGGSGIFFYLAVAINANGRYQGTNAFLLGDRITPKDIGLRNGAVVVNYVDRRHDETMSATPSVDQTTVLVLNNDQLIDIAPPGEKNRIAEGWMTIGHEVRSFEPCGRHEPLWLMGQSPTIKAALSRKKGHR